jgi:hypothetical protein
VFLLCFLSDGLFPLSKFLFCIGIVKMQIINEVGEGKKNVAPVFLLPPVTHTKKGKRTEVSRFDGSGKGKVCVERKGVGQSRGRILPLLSLRSVSLRLVERFQDLFEVKVGIVRIHCR